MSDHRSEACGILSLRVDISIFPWATLKHAHYLSRRYDLLELYVYALSTSAVSS
jgi:hypothetical protein